MLCLLFLSRKYPFEGSSGVLSGHIEGDGGPSASAAAKSRRRPLVDGEDYGGGALERRLKTRRAEEGLGTVGQST